MPTDPSFKDYIIDQLSGLDGILAKRMFGGFGLYSHGTFFGIISDNILYLKTDEKTKKKFIDASMGPFKPNDKQILKNYFEVPEEVIDDREELATWVDEAIEVSSK